MLKLLDGDGVELIHAAIKVAILFQGQSSCGRLALKMRVVHQYRGQIAQHCGQPLGWDLFTPQQHGCVLAEAARGTRLIRGFAFYGYAFGGGTSVNAVLLVLPKRSWMKHVSIRCSR